MDEITVSLRLPRALLEAAERLARDRDESLGRVLRQALSAEIMRANRNAKTPNRADEQLLGPLRVLLASDFAEARSWNELQSRLAAKGYALREAGGGLALHSHPQGLRLCKGSELGQSYGTLMRRFGTPFPGHAHRWLANRVLGAPPDPDEDFDVIEREPFGPLPVKTGAARRS
ncbi:hypothetical protein [Aestuariicoccus sp. MJ-SS9]|uniref:hypothetical protein n=1 Tax=Aestuariicoccus sp. MJ-SS9 TaxID=3079855 RepID=UPI00290E5613|nr:hypothetical protein [Aestuariicoccus sp. MJ-SS9]MDU8910098.1 hypothetical protein [Aestuariicoccus sp. MJ-SS9]